MVAFTHASKNRLQKIYITSAPRAAVTSLLFWRNFINLCCNCSSMKAIMSIDRKLLIFQFQKPKPFAFYGFVPLRREVNVPSAIWIAFWGLCDQMLKCHWCRSKGMRIFKSIHYDVRSANKSLLFPKSTLFETFMPS